MTRASLRRRTAAGRRPRSITVLGLVVLLVGTLSLSAYAIQRSTTLSPGMSSSTPRAPVAVSAPTPSPSTTAAAVVVLPKRYLSAFSGTEAWRGTAGECPGGSPELERTDDSGETWEKFQLTGLGVSAGLLRLEASNDGLAYVIAQSDSSDCEPVYVATYSNGEAFESYPERTKTSWFVGPGRNRTIQTPGGTSKVPCLPLSVAPRTDTEAAVLCSDETVVRTTDSGESWDEGVAVAGAVALDDTADGFVVASAGRKSCDGVYISTLQTSASKAQQLNCVSVDAEADEIAISGAGDSLWLWAGSTLAVSTDGGVSWADG